LHCAAHRVWLENDRVRVLEVAIEPGRADIPGKPARRGDPVRKLPDRVWRLPRQEDDEAAEEGIGRILALSDGVFAIAITLLILEIAVPATTSDTDLPKALLELWPRYLAYVLSFVVIARFWVTHHQAFRLIARYDTVLIWLNLVLLMFVSFLPFPTAVLGAHNGSPAAAVLYAAAVALAGAASAAYWWYASGRGRLLRPDVEPARVRAIRARGLSAPVFFALTVPVAAFAPHAAEILWLLVFPLTRITYVWFSERHNQVG
jgi:TMEM175 potassium channel family protein